MGIVGRIATLKLCTVWYAIMFSLALIPASHFYVAVCM